MTDPEAANASLAQWLPRLLQLSDTFYPTGAYAHSFGLEGLTQEGWIHDTDTLRRFLLETLLPSLARTDLPLAAHAWAAAGDPPDWAALENLCFLGAAVRGAREPRAASDAIGRQRLALAARLQGGIAAAFEARAEAQGWPRPTAVAAAIEARALGAPVEAALAGIVYAALAGQLAAAMKLLRLGQTTIQSLLTESLAHAETITRRSGGSPLFLALPSLELIGAFTPWSDIASARHESADSRLFIS